MAFDIQALLAEDVQSALGLSDLPEAERLQLLEEFGSLVIDRACEDLLLMMTEEEQSQFVSFVDSQSVNDGFLERILMTYPALEPLLEAALVDIKTDLMLACVTEDDKD